MSSLNFLLFILALCSSAVLECYALLNLSSLSVSWESSQAVVYFQAPNATITWSNFSCADHHLWILSGDDFQSLNSPLTGSVGYQAPRHLPHQLGDDFTPMPGMECSLAQTVLPDDWVASWQVRQAVLVQPQSSQSLASDHGCRITTWRWSGYAWVWARDSWGTVCGGLAVQKSSPREAALPGNAWVTAIVPLTLTVPQTTHTVRVITSSLEGRCAPPADAPSTLDAAAMSTANGSVCAATSRAFSSTFTARESIYMQGSIGLTHSCFVRSWGLVQCWGDNSHGQLGYGHKRDVGIAQTPTRITDWVNLGQGVSAVDVCASTHHSCAVLSDRSLSCWGRNSVGQLGYGMGAEIFGDDEIPGLRRVDLGPGAQVLAVTCGGLTTCVLRGDGRVTCWGNGADGLLGNGTTRGVGLDDVPGNRSIDFGPGAVATSVSMGTSHACASFQDGTVSCWGEGTLGRLGYGNEDSIGDDEVPGTRRVDLGPGSFAVSVSVGRSHSCAVFVDGSVACWGFPNDGLLGSASSERIGDNEVPGVRRVDFGPRSVALRVSAAAAHSCATFSDGSAVCWGTNSLGSLGFDPSTTPFIGRDSVPGDLRIPATRSSHVYFGLAGGSTERFSCFVWISGGITCVGNMAHGELGLGPQVTQSIPGSWDLSLYSTDAQRTCWDHQSWQALLVPSARVFAGSNVACALTVTGAVSCWGSNAEFVLGKQNLPDTGFYSPPLDDRVSFAALSQRAVHDMCLGQGYACAVMNDGALACWGKLPIGISGGARPMNIGAGATARQVGCGVNHACVVLGDGGVTCFGSGTHGRLGYNSTAAVGAALVGPGEARVDIGAGGTAVQVDAFQHTCAVRSNGTLVCWGNNADGELGYGHTQDIGDDEPPGNLAVDFGPGAHAVQVAVGVFSCALFVDGSVSCWGNAYYGLGYGGSPSIGDNEVPGTRRVNLGAGAQATKLAFSHWHICALLSDHSMTCWGQSSYGGLGLGDFIPALVSTYVPGDHRVQAGGPVLDVATGSTTTCAVLLGGGIKCWGTSQDRKPYGLGYGSEIVSLPAPPQELVIAITQEPRLPRSQTLQCMQEVLDLYIPPYTINVQLIALPAVKLVLVNSQPGVLVHLIGAVGELLCPLQKSTPQAYSSAGICSASSIESWESSLVPGLPAPFSGKALTAVHQRSGNLQTADLLAFFKAGQFEALSPGTSLSTAGLTPLVIVGSIEHLFLSQATLCIGQFSSNSMQWLTPRALSCWASPSVGANASVWFSSGSCVNSSSSLGAVGQVTFRRPQASAAHPVGWCNVSSVVHGAVVACTPVPHGLPTDKLSPEGGTVLSISGSGFGISSVHCAAGGAASAPNVTVTVGGLACPIVCPGQVPGTKLSPSDSLLMCVAPAMRPAWRGQWEQRLVVTVAGQAAAPILVEYAAVVLHGQLSIALHSSTEATLGTASSDAAPMRVYAQQGASGVLLATIITNAQFIPLERASRAMFITDGRSQRPCGPGSAARASPGMSLAWFPGATPSQLVVCANVSLDGLQPGIVEFVLNSTLPAAPSVATRQLPLRLVAPPAISKITVFPDYNSSMAMPTLSAVPSLLRIQLSDSMFGRPWASNISVHAGAHPCWPVAQCAAGGHCLQCRVHVPDPTASAEVAVQFLGSDQARSPLQRTAPPAITRAATADGRTASSLPFEGGYITLEGLGLVPSGTAAELARIDVGGRPCASWAVLSAGKVACTYAASAHSALITVHTADGLSANWSMTRPFPELTAVEPSAVLPCIWNSSGCSYNASRYTPVLFTGRNLGVHAEDLVIRLGNARCYVTQVASTSARCLLDTRQLFRNGSLPIAAAVGVQAAFVRPQATLATVGALTVGRLSSKTFTYASVITVSGTGFALRVQGQLVPTVRSVLWGEQALSFTAVSDTSLLVLAPSQLQNVTAAAIHVQGEAGELASSADLVAGPSITAVVSRIEAQRVRGDASQLWLSLFWPESALPSLFEVKIWTGGPRIWPNTPVHTLQLDSGSREKGATYPATFLLTGVPFSTSVWADARGSEGRGVTGAWSGLAAVAVPACDSGTFLATHLPLASQACSPCPAARNCSQPGLSSGNVGVMPGHAVLPWAPAGAPAAAVLCPVAAACHAVLPNATSSSVSSAECAPGFTGPLCASCLPGFSLSSSGCAECSGGQGGAIALLCFAWIGVVAGLGWMAAQQAQPNAGTSLGDGDVLKKVMINHAQLIGLCSGLQVDWPNPAEGWIALNDAASALGEVMIAPGCLAEGNGNGLPGSIIRAVILGVMPLAVLATQAAVLACWRLIRPQQVQALKRLPVALVVVSLYVLYTPATRAALQLFACQEIGGQMRWSADFTVSCESTLLSAWRVGLGMPVLVLLTIGFPVVAAWWMVRHKAAIGEGDTEAGQAMYQGFGLMFLGYKAPVAPWYEATVLMRKVGIAACIVTAAPQGIHTQVYLACLVLLPAYIAQMRLQPYIKPVHNGLEELHMGVSLATLISGQFIANMGTDSGATVSAAVLVLLLNLVFLGVWGWQLAILCRVQLARHRHRLQDAQRAGSQVLRRMRATVRARAECVPSTGAPQDKAVVSTTRRDTEDGVTENPMRARKTLA